MGMLLDDNIVLEYFNIDRGWNRPNSKGCDLTENTSTLKETQKSYLVAALTIVRMLKRRNRNNICIGEGVMYIVLKKRLHTYLIHILAMIEGHQINLINRSMQILLLQTKKVIICLQRWYGPTDEDRPARRAV